MISIIKDLDSAFYSVYRPIIITGYDTDTDTAFLRGELLIETPMWSGTYVSTGIIMNGYESSDNQSIYEFNLMEHCRPFVGDGNCPPFSATVYYLPGDFEARRFKLDIWAVKYSSGLYGQLYDDLSGLVTTKSCTAVATVTTDEYSLNIGDDFTVMDRLVLGYNHPSYFPNSHQPLTNAPNKEYATGITTSQIGPLDHQIINMNDYVCDSIYQPVKWSNTHEYLTMLTAIRNKSTQNWSLEFIPIVNNISNGGELVRIPLHPATLELMYLLNTGIALNKFIDASGNLIADLFFILPVLSDATFGNQLMWTLTEDVTAPRYRGYALTDVDNNNRCKHKKFVFQNMKGGFDWFNCYGTNSKSVNVSGETYENHVSENIRGNHVKQKLWNKRVDKYSVITQPLTTDKAEWLQELVSSPKVWVQETVKDSELPFFNNKYLRPILIDDSDFAIHNTEDNVHFIEFSYTLSNPTSTQRG